MKIETWNKLIKPLEVDTEAVDGDIVDYIDSLYCLCQCERNGIKDANNIVVLAYEYNLKHIKAMFKFIVKLYDKGIRYIRVEGSKDRYKIMKKLFDHNMLLQEVNGRDVYYCKLDESVIYKMKHLIEQ